MKVTLEYLINALYYADTYDNSIGTVNKSMSEPTVYYDIDD